MTGVAKARLASLMRLFGVPRAACSSLVNFPYPGHDQTKRHVEKGQFFFCFVRFVPSYTDRTKFLFYECGLTMKKPTEQSHYEWN